MVHLLRVLNSETEFNCIEQNNNLSTKKCRKLGRQQDEIVRSLCHLESCNLQVKRMTLIAEQKSEKVKSEVEVHRAVAEKMAQRASASINASFEQVDLIRAINHLSLHNLSPITSISLSYDKCIEDSIHTENKLRSSIGEVTVSKDSLKSEKDSIMKIQQATIKAKGKAEKDILKLQEEVNRQNGIITAIQSSSSEIKNKLHSIRLEVEEVDGKRATSESELNDAEKIRDTVFQELESNEASTADVISVLNELYSKLQTENNVNGLSVGTLSDTDEISKLADELQSLVSENKDFPETDDISETDSIGNLESSLASAKKEAKNALKTIEQMRDYSRQYAVINETLSRKKSGIEAVRKQMVENETVLSGLKAAGNSEKLSDAESRISKKEELFRQLEATKNDIPGPEPYQQYQTPNQAAPSKKHEKQTARALKRASIASGSTRNISTNVPQYPGIKLLGQENTDMESIPPHRESSEQQNKTMNSDLDLSISDDSATTQDESAINGIFSPLNNEKRASSPPVEFSMAAHMTEFSQRQAKMKAIQSIKNAEVSKDDIDQDEENESKLSIDLDVSAIDSEGEDEDADDDDDDLFAPDDEDMDQSAWGDDD
ncbi:hypothetical protein L5515_000637 [Caenorhabditis briggsae]|uniref:Uncharacterized protein n=1 Tax=Caenorhabditis briggsae TaxID=6238 RepID=A0AAE9E265_CAEBR|nr:hypothetical protein L5515_000637 [Caenorhabditis briggsae]